MKNFKDADYRLASKKILTQNMACWVGAHGQVYLAKNAKTCPNCNVTHREPRTRNETFFLQSVLEDVPSP